MVVSSVNNHTSEEDKEIGGGLVVIVFAATYRDGGSFLMFRGMADNKSH